MELPSVITVVRRAGLQLSSSKSIGIFAKVLIALTILAQSVAAQTNASYIDPNSVDPNTKGSGSQNLILESKLIMAELHGVTARKASAAIYVL
jgi:hypothetical protein